MLFLSGHLAEQQKKWLELYLASSLQRRLRKRLDSLLQLWSHTSKKLHISQLHKLTSPLSHHCISSCFQASLGFLPSIHKHTLSVFLSSYSRAPKPEPSLIAKFVICVSLYRDDQMMNVLIGTCLQRVDSYETEIWDQQDIISTSKYLLCHQSPIQDVWHSILQTFQRPYMLSWPSAWLSRWSAIQCLLLWSQTSRMALPRSFWLLSLQVPLLAYPSPPCLQRESYPFLSQRMNSPLDQRPSEPLSCICRE